MIWPLAFTLGSFVVIASFWLRGLYRDNRADQILGMAFLMSFSITAVLQGLVNVVGFCAMALGALTIVAGLAGKRISSTEVYSTGLLLAVFGLFFALLL